MDTITHVIETLIIPYWWQGMALLISPLFGYAVGQWYKRPGITSSRRIMAVAGSSTGAMSALCWLQAYPATVSQALIIGMMMAALQPIMVWIWYQVAKRLTPAAKVFANTGEGEDATYYPYTLIKKPKK